MCFSLRKSLKRDLEKKQKKRELKLAMKRGEITLPANNK
jgi:hypothetical protein